MQKAIRGQSMQQKQPCNLCDIMLRDSAHIRCLRLSGETVRGEEGKPEFIPAYTMEDAMGVLQLRQMPI